MVRLILPQIIMLRFEPTYKELKPIHFVFLSSNMQSFEPTYKELKPIGQPPLT